MKNLLNKVLVVLTVSVLYASVVSAAEPQAKRLLRRGGGKRVETPAQTSAKTRLIRKSESAVDPEVEAVAKMERFERMKNKGGDDINRFYPHALRMQDANSIKESVTESEYNTVYSFLVSAKGGNSPQVRGKFASAAIKIIENVQANQGKKQEEDAKAALKIAQENPTPENIAVAQNEVSTLTKIYGYLPSKEKAAAAAAIGIVIAGLASLGMDYRSGATLGTTAIGAGRTIGGAIMASPGKFVAGVKATPGTIAAGIRGTGNLIWSNGKWVVSKLGSAASMAESALGLGAAYRWMRGTPAQTQEVQTPVVTTSTEEIPEPAEYQ